MKVKELIAHLQTLNQELPIHVNNDYWMSSYPLVETKIIYTDEGIPHSYSNPGGAIMEGYFINA